MASPAATSAVRSRARFAFVVGATRGGGRGLAVALGERGWTVFCSGRSSSASSAAADNGEGGRGGGDANGEPKGRGTATDLVAPPGTRPETVEETAALVDAAGGRGVPVIADHREEEQVRRAFADVVAQETGGKLHLLVDSVWGCDSLAQWGVGIPELDLAKGRAMLDNALLSHVVTLKHATPLLLAAVGDEAFPAPLVVQVTDGDSMHYRGSLFYDLVKTSVIRLAFAAAETWRDDGVHAIAVTPGFLRSEAMLEHFNAVETAEEVDAHHDANASTEERRQTWQEAAAEQDPHFAFSESPALLGRCVAAYADNLSPEERARRSGGLFSSWALAKEFGVCDADGSRPDWGAHAASESFGADQAASHRRFLEGLPPPAPVTATADARSAAATASATAGVDVAAVADGT